MIALLCLAIGAVYGWFRAARRGGTTADKMQYAAVHGMVFGLIALAAAIAYDLAGLSSGN